MNFAGRALQIFKQLVVTVLMVFLFNNMVMAENYSGYYKPKKVLFTEQDLSNDRLQPTNLGRLRLGVNTIEAEFARDDFDYFTVKVPRWLVLDQIRLIKWDTRPCFEDVGFFAVVEGDSFDFVFPNTQDPNNPAAGLLGWTHLRSTLVDSTAGICQGDIICEMGLANLPPVDSGLSATYDEEAGIATGENPYANIPAEQICDGVDAAGLQARLVNLSNSWAPGAEGFVGPLGPGKYSFWLRQGSDTRVAVKMELITKLRY